MVDMINLDDGETELYMAETFQQILEMPNKDSFLDAIIKYELTCNVGIGENSFWQWVCQTIQHYFTGPLIVKTGAENKVRCAFKILVMMTQSESSNIEFLLTLGLAEFLNEILSLNDQSQPVSRGFVLEFDTYLKQIITNLVDSQVNNFGDRLIDGGSQWILDRFSSRMGHEDTTVRLESLRLILILMKQQTDHRKIFLI